MKQQAQDLKSQNERLTEENKCLFDTLTTRIAQLECDLQSSKLGKKYSALLKIFEECQNTWKAENDNLKKLLLEEQTATSISQNCRNSTSILSLNCVKAIIEDVIKEYDHRHTERHFGMHLGFIRLDTIKESIYSSLSLSLTGAIKFKNCTNSTSINCISEINPDDIDNEGFNDDYKSPSKQSEKVKSFS